MAVDMYCPVPVNSATVSRYSSRLTAAIAVGNVVARRRTPSTPKRGIVGGDREWRSLIGPALGDASTHPAEGGDLTGRLDYAAFGVRGARRHALRQEEYPAPRVTVVEDDPQASVVLCLLRLEVAAQVPQGRPPQHRMRVFDFPLLVKTSFTRWLHFSKDTFAIRTARKRGPPIPTVSGMAESIGVPVPTSYDRRNEAPADGLGMQHRCVNPLRGHPMHSALAGAWTRARIAKLARCVRLSVQTSAPQRHA
jgi:hypothetical protein